MRKMPMLTPVQKTEKMTSTFMGYNRAEIISDGEMYDTFNVSGDYYPALGPRKRMGFTSYDEAGQEPVPLQALYGRDQLVMIRGTEVFWNFTKVNGVSVAQEAAEKKIVSMGAYVCIWPDKVYFNTVDLSDCGSMQRLWSGTGSSVSVSLCRGDGTDYDMTAITVSGTAPASPGNGQLWIDQSGDTDVLRQYTSSTQEWTEVPTVYVKIAATGIGEGLKEYDTITTSGLEAAAGAAARVKNQIAALNGSLIVYAAGTDYIVTVGILEATQNALKANTVKADRTVPDLDFICESNNRLWGCRYGLENGKVVNEIRACKLGDFRNWSCFMGLSTDSYTASVGTDSRFTGAITLKGYPLFFKEQCIHRVSGTTPGSFQITTTMCRGIKSNCHQSAVVVNEAVYYLSRGGVMVYDGSMPTPVGVGEKLGPALGGNGRGGVLGDKYYLFMTGKNSGLYTYDTVRGVWYKECISVIPSFFARVRDELYCIDAITNCLVSITGSKGTLEAEFPWSAEFGMTGLEYNTNEYGSRVRTDTRRKMYLSRFDIRMYLEEGGHAKLEIMYNSDGNWTDCGKVMGRGTGSFLLPVIPRRCDHLRVRISGNGDFRIYSISRIMEVGSDA